MRLRFLTKLNPNRAALAHLSPVTEVTFAPMEALADGIGGLDTSTTKTIEEVGGGSYSFFAEGDVLLAKVTPCFENGKKAIALGLTNGFGFATSEVHVIRPDTRKLNRDYLRYLLCSETFRAAGMASMTGAGGLKRVSEDAIRNFRIPIVDLQIQAKITDFLDQETTRIDQLIDKKEQLVTLLREKRLAAIGDVITRYQTRAECRKLKHLIKYGTSISYGIVQPGDHEPAGVPFVQTANLVQRTLDPADLPRTSPSIEAKYPRSRLNAGDVILGIRASIGDCLVVPPPLQGANLSRGIARIQPSGIILSDYLVLTLSSPRTLSYWSIAQQGSTFREVSIEAVRELSIPVPAIGLQKEALREFETLTGGLDLVTERVMGSIEKTSEFRSALITAAVTGQIDAATWVRRGETDRHLDRIEEQMPLREARA